MTLTFCLRMAKSRGVHAILMLLSSRRRPWMAVYHQQALRLLHLCLSQHGSDLPCKRLQCSVSRRLEEAGWGGSHASLGMESCPEGISLRSFLPSFHAVLGLAPASKCSSLFSAERVEGEADGAVGISPRVAVLG